MEINSHFHSPLCGGTDSDGSQIYVGRALHNGIFVPAKIMPEKQEAYISKFFVISDIKNLLEMSKL